MPASRPVSLRQRLLIITGGCALVVLLTATALLLGSNRLRGNVTDATAEILEEQRIADRIISGVMRQLVTITSATEQGFEPLRPEFEAAGAQVYEGLREYLFRDLSVDERLQIESVKEEHQLLEVAALRAAERQALGDSAGRIEQRREAMAHALELLEAMNGFLEMREADLAAIAVQQERSFRILWLAGSLTLLILAAGIGVFLMRFVRRRVVAPLATLADTATRFGEGDASARAPAGLDVEFHQLSLAFNRMSERLVAAQGTLATRNTELEEALQHVQEARDELVQSEKLSAVGRMSAGLAHELNNPLAAVVGYAELLATELQDDKAVSAEQVRSHVEPLVREAMRARQLVRSLLVFSRRAEDGVSPIRLADSLEVVSDLRRRSFEQEGLEFQLDPIPDVAVLAESQRLQGVILNITNNSLQAMRGQPASRFRIHGRVQDGRIHLMFDDDGPGIRHPDRIFEPFYTTKEPGEGTGLGLSLAKRFVESFGGEIRVANRPEGGARFTVILAVADKLAEPEVVSRPTVEEQPRTSGVVLVVDDEPELRRLTRRALTLAGMEVVEADSVAAAREVLSRCKVDVVVSDVRMPGESGAKLYRWVAANHPDLAGRFLFVTGDVDVGELADFAAKQPDAMLYKPFSLADLTGRVTALLAATGR